MFSKENGFVFLKSLNISQLLFFIVSLLIFLMIIFDCSTITHILHFLMNKPAHIYIYVYRYVQIKI